MLQKVMLIGYLGKDPEMRYTPKGTPLTNMSVATNSKWHDASGDLHEQTVWFRVVAFGKLGEICNQYLEKGRQVYIEGSLIPDEKSGGPRVWERKDGTPGASFEVRASVVRFLGAHGTNDRSGQAVTGGEAGAEEEFGL